MKSRNSGKRVRTKNAYCEIYISLKLLVGFKFFNHPKPENRKKKKKKNMKN